jgi:hypothetical protein
MLLPKLSDSFGSCSFFWLKRTRISLVFGESAGEKWFEGGQARKKTALKGPAADQGRNQQ